jgi:AcrR family transcriptional regulator
MENKRGDMVTRACKVFMTKGVKSINMDDIARELGISKKTLYVHFKDKNDLVLASINNFTCQEDLTILAIQNQGLNAIDENLEIKKWVVKSIEGLHPSIMHDLEKYYPEAYEIMQTKRSQVVSQILIANLKKGQQEGLYRTDFNPLLVAQLYIARMESFFVPKYNFNQFGLTELYLESFNLHIRGIASAKGMAYLEEKYHTRITKKK